jgi:hypothetical protein
MMGNDTESRDPRIRRRQRFHARHGSRENDHLALHPLPRNRRRDLAWISPLDLDQHTRPPRPSALGAADAQHVCQRRHRRIETPEFRPRYVTHPSPHAAKTVEPVIVIFGW